MDTYIYIHPSRMENLILQWKRGALDIRFFTAIQAFSFFSATSCGRFKNGTNLGVGNPTNMWKGWETCGKTRGKHHWFNIVWIP